METSSFLATFYNDSTVVTEIECGSTNAPLFILITSTVLQYALTIFSLVFGINAIFNYYLKSTTILKELKISSILCTITWMISALTWLINFHSTILICYPSVFFDITFFIGTISMILSYFLLIISFAIRLIYSFKESILKINKHTKKIIYFMIIIASLFAIFAVMLFFVESNLAFIFVILSLLTYLVLSSFLVKVIISKMIQFIKFVNYSPRIDSLSNTTSSDRRRTTMSKSADTNPNKHFEVRTKTSPSSVAIPPSVELSKNISLDEMEFKVDKENHLMTLNVASVECAIMNDKNIRFNNEMYELITKLIVVYSIALFSTLITLCIAIYTAFLIYYGNNLMLDITNILSSP